MADLSAARGRSAVPDGLAAPRSIVELIQAGTLDAELAATLWVLIAGGVPIVVAGADEGIGKSTLLIALVGFLPSRVRRMELTGATESFDWLPQATELGWHGAAGAGPASARPARDDEPPVRPETTILIIPELSDHLPSSTWGDEARLALRAASIGYGLAATTHADGLDEVLDSLHRPPVSATDDELSRLGAILVLRRVDGNRRRIVAAHYLRPTARDEHGHVQRLGPAVLATWDPARDRFEHFGWGINPELALRVGLKAGDFEVEVDHRRAFLEGLAAAGTTDPSAVRTAIADYRPLVSPPRERSTEPSRGLYIPATN